MLKENNKYSLGRVSFWIVFALLIWYWVAIRMSPGLADAPASLQNAFFSLLAYNLGKKIKDVMAIKKGDKNG